MGKKGGQMHSEVVRVLIVALVVILIFYFGFKAISKISEKRCQSELILFERDLKASSDAISSQIGSVEEKRYSVPCKAEKIYFADLDKDMDSFVKSLYYFPLVVNFMKSGITKNVVLVKNGKIIDSFYMGDIDLQKPYFVCADTTRGNLDLYLAGKGSSTEVVNKDCSYDCTFEVVDIDEDTAREVIQDAINFGCQGCPQGSLEEEMENFIRTNQTVRIARRCNCGRKPGQAVVEILIKPEGKLKHFKLIESIPKDYIDDLEMYLENMSGSYDYYKILWDPLIMWHFNEISEETIVRYVLNENVFEYCAETLKVVGLAVTFESENATEEEELDRFEKEIPEFSLDDVKIPPGSTAYPVFSNPVWAYLKASDILPFEKRNYLYQISVDEELWAGSVSSPGLRCEIREADKHIICDAGKSFPDETFYVRVLDFYGSEIAQSSFAVSPFYCGALDEHDCKSNSGCEWCEVCEGTKWSGYENDTCVDLGDCSYNCSLGYCGAECDLNTKCFDACYDGRHFYECGGMGCKKDCTCLSIPSIPPSGCKGAPDEDGDGYQRGCDCLDNLSIYAYAANVYPTNSDLYCNCDSGDGYDLDILSENECSDGYDDDCDGCTDSFDSDCGGDEDICSDGIDNDCDGNMDCNDFDCVEKGVCNKLKCTKVAESGCVANFNTQCNEWDRGQRGQCCETGFLRRCTKWEYKCYDDWFTECSENPTCDGGSVVETLDVCIIKLKCTKLAESGCVHNFDDECDEWDRGWRTGDCGPWYNRKDEYVCYDDWETECSGDPTCAGGSVVQIIPCCTPSCQWSNICEESVSDGCGGSCTRDTDGTACADGICTGGSCAAVCSPSCGACGGFYDVCDTTGTQTCTNADCSTYDQSCTRYTDGVGCAGGICKDGSCVAVCTPSCQYSDVCDESVSDGCGGTCTRDTDGVTCGTGKVCGNGGCVSAEAGLSASYSNLRKNQGSPPSGFGGGNWWYFDVRLEETSGNVGITIQKRQKCYSSPQYGNWCDTEKTDITGWFGTDYISKGGEIIANDFNVWLQSGYTMTVVETFWGVDDNGNNKQASYSFTVISD